MALGFELREFRRRGMQLLFAPPDRGLVAGDVRTQASHEGHERLAH